MRENLQEAEWQCVSSCHRLIILLLICLLPLAYPVLISAPPPPPAPSYTLLSPLGASTHFNNCALTIIIVVIVIES